MGDQGESNGEILKTVPFLSLANAFPLLRKSFIYLKKSGFNFLPDPQGVLATYDTMGP